MLTEVGGLVINVVAGVLWAGVPGCKERRNLLLMLLSPDPSNLTDILTNIQTSEVGNPSKSTLF